MTTAAPDRLTAQDRRTAPRVYLGTPGELELSDESGRAAPVPVTVVDLSEGGVQFHVAREVAREIGVGSPVWLAFNLPPFDARVRLCLSVIRQGPLEEGGIALHCSFQELSVRTQWEIVRSCVALASTSTATDCRDDDGIPAETPDAPDRDEVPADEPVPFRPLASPSDRDAGEATLPREDELPDDGPSDAMAGDEFSEDVSADDEDGENIQIVAEFPAMRPESPGSRTLIAAAEPVPQASVSAIEAEGPLSAPDCSVCGAGPMELLRSATRADVLLSWWQCLACDHIAQSASRGAATTSTPRAARPEPGEAGATSADSPHIALPPTASIDAAVTALRAREAEATERGARLREELSAIETELMHLREARRHLEAIGVE